MGHNDYTTVSNDYISFVKRSMRTREPDEYWWGLREELGEVCGVIKKWKVRGSPGYGRTHLVDECGDVLFYAVAVCVCMGLPLPFLRDGVRGMNLCATMQAAFDTVRDPPAVVDCIVDLLAEEGITLEEVLTYNRLKLEARYGKCDYRLFE